MSPSSAGRTILSSSTDTDPADLLLLPNPSGNRVYAGAAAELAAAEVAITVPGVDPESVRTVTVGGVDHVAFRAPIDRDVLAQLSSRFLVSTVDDRGRLTPLDLGPATVLDDDLVTIPKYPGKTNEQFTRLLLGVAVGALPAQPTPYKVLDPLCGRGTTTSCAWLAGHHGYGVELDRKAIESHAAFLRTWLRRKRLKHKVSTSPVRREGTHLGARLDATVTVPGTGTTLELGIMPGDTRASAELWGRRRFDAVVTDAPYGVVHGSRRGSGRQRTAADLLAEAVPVWAGQLRRRGVMAIGWNTLGLPREDLLSMMADAGLEPRDDGPWRRLGHRVDSSVHRDVAVAVRG